MRIIEYPPAEPEIEIRCPHCKALLGYTASECFYEDRAFGYVKYIKCINCRKEIRLDYIPHPIIAGDKFYEFNDGSWVKEANP